MIVTFPDGKKDVAKEVWKNGIDPRGPRLTLEFINNVKLVDGVILTLEGVGTRRVEGRLEDGKNSTVYLLSFEAAE